MFDIIIFAITVAVIAAIAVITFKNKKNFYVGVFSAALAMVLSFVVSVAVAKLFAGVSPIDEAIDIVFNSLALTLSSLPSDMLNMFGRLLPKGQTGEITPEMLTAALETAKSIYRLLYPAFTIMFYVAFCYIGFILIKNIMKLFKKDVSFAPDFNSITLRKSIFWAMLASVLLTLIFKSTLIGAAFANIQLILLFYTTVCGLALIDFWLACKIPIAPVRLLIYIIIMLFSGGLAGILIQLSSLLAVLDMFFKFRTHIGGDLYGK